jgi:phosphatidylglycerol:prolipoprotein diacylglycerol transferase
MYPVLFKIPIFGGITIYSYGVMVALGFVAGMLWVRYDSKRNGQDPGRAMDLVFYVILAAIVGSRILHVAVSDRERFLANPLMILRVWEGGLVFYGGLIAAVAVSLWYIRRHRMPLMLTCDIFSPAIALGHAIGRVGCFLAGCCFGRVAGDGAWYTVIFPASQHGFAPAGVPLYPTQLMEATGEFVNFCILLLIGRHKRFDGQVFAAYLMIYALIRAFGEYFRGDYERGFVIEPWLSTSGFISIFIFAAGLAIYLWRRRAGRETPAGRPA